MFCPRVIPVLLLRNLGLVKSVKFRNYRYIGDPINAVRIFNDEKADELVFLDINASKENRLISLEFVHKVGEEANMPFAVGGGIRTIQHIREVLQNGAEKVILNTSAFENPRFIEEAAKAFGSSTIVVCLDVKRNMFGRYQLVYRNGRKKAKEEPIVYARMVENYGAGEIIIQSVDRDGTYLGYDFEIIRRISESVSVPVVALGGARDYQDFQRAVKEAHASAVAAGSLFVYHGSRHAVLVNYPTRDEINGLFVRKSN